MPTPTARTLAAAISDQGAALKISFPASETLMELRTTLEKRLLKNGIALRLAQPPELIIQLVLMDQGNQMLRYLLPFISPAVMEVEGQIALAGKPLQAFHYVQKAQMGLFGGSPKGMLKVCAQRIAEKIAKDVLRAIKA